MAGGGEHNRFSSFGHASESEWRARERISVWGPYGYQPSLAGGVVFTIVYGLCAIVLTYQSLRRSDTGQRRWWMLATLAFGALCECVGNAVRIYGHYHPTVVDPYIAQQVILVLTPAFFAAAHFTILTKICQLYGEKYLRPLRSAWLIPAFVTLDVVSLIVQGVGSGQAAVAEIDGEAIDTINDHGMVVVAGLAVQLFAYLVFNVLFLTVVARVYLDKSSDTAWFHDARMQRFLLATFVSALLVLARSAFRTAELGIGWIGEVATTEWYYLVFDATFVALAVIIMCAVSPSAHLPTVGRTVHEDDEEKGSVVASTKSPATPQRIDSSFSHDIEAKGIAF